MIAFPIADRNDRLQTQDGGWVGSHSYCLRASKNRQNTQMKYLNYIPSQYSTYIAPRSYALQVSVPRSGGGPAGGEYRCQQALLFLIFRCYFYHRWGGGAGWRSSGRWRRIAAICAAVGFDEHLLFDERGGQGAPWAVDCGWGRRRGCTGRPECCSSW